MRTTPPEYLVALRELSGQIEAADGWDSLHTMETNYPTDDDTGATLCPFPQCDFRRHDPVQMFKHVHFSPMHGLTYGVDFETFLAKARSIR